MAAIKKTIIGAVFLFAGLFADLGILLFGAICGAAMTQWQSDLGKVWTAIFDNYLILPFVLATALMLLGGVFLFREYFTDRK